MQSLGGSRAGWIDAGARRILRWRSRLQTVVGPSSPHTCSGIVCEESGMKREARCRSPVSGVSPAISSCRCVEHNAVCSSTMVEGSVL